MSGMTGDTARGHRPVADTEDGRWLSYTELAAERGISRASAIRMVRRQRWRRQAGNDGEARVLVPADALPGDQAGGNDTGQTPGHALGDDTGQQSLMASALTALEDAVTALREQLTHANGRADSERQRADRLDLLIETERGRIVAVEAKAAAREAELRGRLDDLGAKLTDAQAELAAAQDKAGASSAEVLMLARKVNEAAEADAERRARGLLARLRAAWRGS
jgi:hypothetical protein